MVAFKITNITYDTYDEEAEEHQTQEDLGLPTEMVVQIELQGDEEEWEIYDLLTYQIENQGYGWLVESFDFDTESKSAESFGKYGGRSYYDEHRVIGDNEKCDFTEHNWIVPKEPFMEGHTNLSIELVCKNCGVRMYGLFDKKGAGKTIQYGLDGGDYRAAEAAEIVEYECARCGGLGDLCRGCSGLGADYPEEFGSCDLPEFPCPYCDATGKVTSNEKAKEFSRSIGYQLERVGEGMLGFSLFPTRMYHSKEKLEKIKAHKEEIMAQVANHYGLEPAEIEEDFWWADRWERGHDEFIEEVKATNGWGDPDILEKMLNNPEKWGGDSPYRAETFDGEDSLKFKEWAKQEMKTHGDDEDFDDWLYDEMGSHGDNVTLQDWGHHELDSHYERYGAEDNSECDVCSTTLSEGTIDLGCDKGCGAVLCEDCGGGAGNIIHSGWSIEGTCPDGTDEEFVCGNCSQLHGAEECTYCGYEMAISPCCETSYCYCQDFDCDCEKHYDPTGNNYPDIDDETGERYGNWEWSDDYWYQPKNAEELKRDSCCCGATKSKPCACMIQGVMECNATCPCALEKERNWGGDSHGQLATALRNARIKGKEPKKPLKIEKLDAETSGQWEIGEQLEEAQMNAEPYAGRTPEQQAILDERKRKLDYRLALGAKYPRKCSFCLVGIHKGLEDGSLTQEEFDTYMNDPMFPTEGGCERHDYWIAEDEKEKCPSCLEVTFLDGDVCDDCTYCEYCEEYHPDEITQICYENAYHKHYDGPDTDHEDYREAEDKKQKKISGILSNPFDEASLDSGGIKKLVVGGVIAAIAYLGYTKLK